MEVGHYIDHRRMLADVRARRPDGRSVVASAIVAGTVFMAVEMLGRELARGTTAFTTPVRIASLLLGEDVARSSEAPAGLFVLALALHAMLSLVYASVVCLAVRRLPIGLALLGGALFGAMIYVVNHYALTPLFPAFAAARGGIAIAAHVAFGVTAVWVFRLSSRRRTSTADAAPRFGSNARA